MPINDHTKRQTNRRFRVFRATPNSPAPEGCIVDPRCVEIIRVSDFASLTTRSDFPRDEFEDTDEFGLAHWIADEIFYEGLDEEPIYASDIIPLIREFGFDLDAETVRAIAKERGRHTRSGARG